MLLSRLFFLEDLVPLATGGPGGRAPTGKRVGYINLKWIASDYFNPSSGILTYDFVVITPARPPATSAVVTLPNLLNSFSLLLSDGFEFFDHNLRSHGVPLRTWVDEFALEVYIVEERREVVV